MPSYTETVQILRRNQKYILARHGSKEEATPATEAADEEPAEDTADDAEAAEIAGGEE